MISTHVNISRFIIACSALDFRIAHSKIDDIQPSASWTEALSSNKTMSASKLIKRIEDISLYVCLPVAHFFFLLIIVVCEGIELEDKEIIGLWEFVIGQKRPRSLSSGKLYTIKLQLIRNLFIAGSLNDESRELSPRSTQRIAIYSVLQKQIFNATHFLLERHLSCFFQLSAQITALIFTTYRWDYVEVNEFLPKIIEKYFFFNRKFFVLKLMESVAIL